MSNLERTVTELDEARAKRRNLNLPPVDFEQFMQAREADMAAIKSALDFQDEVADYFHAGEVYTGATLPWTKTHETIRLRSGEVTLWSGINGHGKSLVLGHVMLGLMLQKQKCCIASFEMHPYKTLARMTRQFCGSNKPTLEFIAAFMGWCEQKLWLYDQQGTVQQSRVIAVIYYAASQFGVKHFVVDSLMKCGIRSDDWNAQKEFVDKLCAAAKDTGCHIHLVAHSRKGDDEFSAPGKFDVSGSSDITNMVDNVMTVWRNKRKEQDGKDEESPDALVICDKQRNGEWEGKIGLWFDKASFRYLGNSHEKIWPMVNL